MAATIFFIAAFFFIGTEEYHQMLKDDLLNSFLGRFGMVMIPVFMAVASLVTINMIFMGGYNADLRKKFIKQMILISLIILTTANLIGVIAFFAN